MSARILLPFVAGSVFTATVVLLGVGISQAQQRPAVVEAQQTHAAEAPVAPVVAPPPSTPHPMFQGEQTLDTSGGSVLAAANPPKPGARVRTPSDENLPRWVPTRDRLTVVDASDLAENLGLAPRGTLRKTGERVSVQDKLEEEAQARAAQAKAQPQQGGFAFSVKSHVRGRR